VLLGLARREPFARVVPLGNESYGLGFWAMRTASPPPRPRSGWERWDPLLLVDDLEAVVEHALIAVGAIDANVD
jgi:hypothetical protein